MRVDPTTRALCDAYAALAAAGYEPALPAALFEDTVARAAGALDAARGLAELHRARLADQGRRRAAVAAVAGLLRDPLTPAAPVAGPEGD